MLTRRAFVRASGLLTAPAILPRLLWADAAPRLSATYAFVGTYTPNGGGIYLFRIDAESGALTQLQVVDDIRNPSWLAINPGGTRLYAVSEIDNYQGTHNGAVAAYAIDPVSMQLKRLGAVNSGGANSSSPTMRDWT
jgi:6-phosphogluconolactonase